MKNTVWVFLAIGEIIAIFTATHHFFPENDELRDVMLAIDITSLTAIILLMFSSRFHTTSFEYGRIGEKTTWLPNEYVVLKTEMTSTANPWAFSISSFCSTKGTVSNKMLLIACGVAGIYFFLSDKVLFVRYAFFIGFGMIGVAESRSEEWGAFHLIGVTVVLISFLFREIAVEKRNLNAIIVIVAFVTFMCISIFFKKREAFILPSGIMAGRKKINFFAVLAIALETVVFSTIVLTMPGTKTFEECCSFF